LSYQGIKWSGSGESNTRSLRPKRSAFPLGYTPKEFSNVKELVDPSGIEPEFQASDACVLSHWTTSQKHWNGHGDSNAD
jgi:hypothetical protein